VEATREALTRSRLIDRIERVDLRVRDIDTSLGFYRDLVGLEVLSRDEHHAELGPPGGPVMLRLDSTGVTFPAEQRSTGLFHVAIRFPNRPALGDVLARLASAQMAIGAGDHLVSEALYIDDPDNNGIELYRDRPVDEWPEPEGDMIVPMATLPVDLDGVLSEGRGADAVGRQAAPGTDIGHVHLQVSDIPATTRFYSEVLGLDLIATLGAQAGFYSSNGYHHHIGANTWNSRGAQPARKDQAGLERIVFAVRERDELQDAKVRLAEFGASTQEDADELMVLDPDGVELRFKLNH
jgi:catechol 2,3-dioxygenase